MAQSMPQVGRHSPLGLHELLNRALVPVAAALVFLGGDSLKSAEETPVVWAASSIGPAYSQFQSLSCFTVATSCPVFSITGAGGLTAQDDTYAFTHRTLRGDGYLVARVSEIKGVPTALAGLSIRASLSPGAAQISLLQAAGGGLVVRKRPQANAPVYQSSLAAVAGAAWLRLERKGQSISLAQSADGTQWSSIPGATIDLPDTAYAGLAVTSQRPDGMATATLSNVQLLSISSLPDGWTKVDLDGSGFSSQAQYSQPYWSISQWVTGTPSSEGISFLYQRVTGDAEIAVRVAGVRPATALAGLMVRGTLDPDNAYLWLAASLQGDRSVQRRQAAGLATTTTALGGGSIPAWLKLARQGGLLSVFSSADGISWTLKTTEAIDLPGSVYIGLALSRGTSLSAMAILDNLRLEAASANQPPSITLTSPSSASSIFEGDPLTVTATASDSDDRVEAVEFFVDSTRVGVDTAAPYVASWITAGVGLHQVTAQARDSDGAIVRTTPVPVGVLARQTYEDGGSTPPPSTTTPPPTTPPPTTTERDPFTRLAGGTTPTSPATSPTATSWRLMFTPSLDHDGIVDRYAAEIYSLDKWALVWSRDLGRPAVVSGECNVDLTQWIAALPAGQYQIVVRAVDDSTTAQSEGATFNFVR
jgi:hypothetical protein